MALVKNAMRVGSITFISRIFGYIRDLVVASFIGTSLINDAFIVAFRLPNLFRTIFGEGAFSSAFVPIFSGLIARKGEKYAKEFAAKVQVGLLFSLFVFCVVMMFFMEDIIYFTAPGFTKVPQNLKFVTGLAQITFPHIIFASMVAFYGGMLNSKGYYLAFAAAPIILNIILIVAVISNNDPSMVAITLSYGVLVAGALEVLWMFYFLRKLNLNVGFLWPLKDDNINKLTKNIGPAMIGSGVAQINVWVSTILASFVPGGISYLYYADRVYQLPLALIGVSIGTILLPVLSKNFSRNNLKTANIHQNNAMEFCMFLCIPAAIAICVMAADFVKILFEYGEFNSESTKQTAAALSIFALGIPAYIVNKIFSAAFFANHDTKTPVKIAAIVLLVNLNISYFLLDLLGHLSIALGSVVSAWLNVILLYILLQRKNHIKLLDGVKSRIVKCFCCGLLMGAILLGCYFLLEKQNFFVRVAIQIAVGGIAYISLVIFTKTYSYKTIKNTIINQGTI